MNILLLGQHGSGKSTQAELLGKNLHLPVISTGEMFRHIRHDESALGQEVKELYDRGEYIPDQITIAVLEDRLRQPDVVRGFILEGYPRTLVQATSLREKFDYVFYLSVPEDESVRRMVARKRHDDTPEAMRRRLDQHNIEAVHVLAHYRALNLLREVDAHRPIEVIQQDLLRQIHPS